jgi:hypothetical protein
MDHYSILDRSLPQPEEAAVPHSAPQPSTALPAVRASVRFPGEDAGSFADMAQRDLDAALQLLADRAQYITDASGAAIALRRKDRNDLLCRATAGTNAPELGALLSAESGLSGESVKTRRPLRCDDTQRDPRVNRDGCRQLGIVSVVVMPIVRDDDALGVFEIFSGKASAFGERDLSALRRLSEMVETAVTLAESAPGSPSEMVADVPVIEERAEPVLGFDADVLTETAPARSTDEVEALDVSRTATVENPLSPAVPVASAFPPPKKPLLWSAALPLSEETQEAAPADQSHVPPVLRSLQKCWACGFPVSEGRKLCVECEEKQWRGQLPASAAVAPTTNPVTAPAQADKSPSRHVKSPPPESWLASNKYILWTLLAVALMVVAAIIFLR